MAGDKKRVYKVAKSVSGLEKVFRKWNDYTEGDYVIGEYIADHKDSYENVCVVIKVLEAKFDDGTHKKFIDKNLVLNAAGSLNKSFEDNVEKGDIVRVEYTGMKTIPKGKRAGEDAHSFKIDIMEDEEDEETQADEGLDL